MGYPIRLAAIFLVLMSGAVKAAEYKTVTIATKKIGNTATVGGTVIPFKEVTLSAQVPGQVQFIAGSEGDDFKKGIVLVTIDDTAIQAQRRAALADIYNAESALRNAQVQYSRELWSPRSTSPSNAPGMGLPFMFDQFFTRNFSNMAGRSDTAVERRADLYAQGSGVSQAQSRLLQARAQVETLDAKIMDARLAAPFDGLIVSKMVETGDTVQPGQPLVKFAQTKFLRIRAEVPVRLVSGLREDMIVPARLDVYGAEIQARVARIYPMANSARHTVTVKFDLPQGVSGGPGMYAEVQIPDPTAQAQDLPIVPESALVWRGSLPGIFILVDGRPSLRLLRIGMPSSPGWVSVLAGLKGGEKVIVDPPKGMASGSKTHKAK